jgi:hypothetical protein
MEQPGHGKASITDVAEELAPLVGAAVAAS